MILWYALHVHPQQERSVSGQLAGAGIEAFYPHLVTEKKDPHSKGGKRTTELKFFPGYTFARFDLLDKTPVIAIPQVVSILGWGRHAAPIDDLEIAAVKLIVSFPALAPLPCAFVSAGDRVRVRRGPLQGLEGYVCYSKSIARVIVSLPMLARSISAEVDAESLELLERADLEKAA
jgi:transcription antitermination factor NusG